MRRTSPPYIRSLVVFLAVALTFSLWGCDRATNPTGPQLNSSTEASESSASGQHSVSSTSAGELIPDQFIIVLEEGTANVPEIARELADAAGGEVLYTYEHAIQGFTIRANETAARALANRPQVQYVEQDRRVEAITQTLPVGIDRIQVDQNATASIDGEDHAMDVDIGIIDTGIDLDHPDLDAQAGKDCIDDGKSTTNDDNGHGTHVAGTVGAIDNTSHVVGAAPGARVHAVKVLDSGGSGTISSVVCGIDYVTDNASTFEVANMSLGAQGTSESMRTAIQNSVDAGIYYAVAAGNDAQDVYGSDGTFGTSDDFIPAAYPEVATISAMAEFDGSSGGNGGSQLFIGCGQIEDDTFADCFSNYSQSVVSGNPVNSPGAAIDVAAPGVSVLSTTNDGGTGRKSGTSMASPHVAGVAALYIVQNGLSPSSATDVYSIRQALIDNGQAQSEWGPSDTKDPDSNPEALVLATFGSTDSSPSVSWVNPTDGEEVSGTVTVQIDASDAEDVDDGLTVEWRVDGAAWQTATYNSTSGYYEASWNSGDVADGDHTLDARATDSAGNTSTSGITVSTENTDNAPSVSWVNPQDGETVSGTITIQIDASDDRDGGSDLTVEWQVDEGTWQTATYNSTSGYYEDSWDTGTVADGDHDLDARATDTGSNTSSEVRATVTVSNTSFAPSASIDGVTEQESPNPHAEFDIAWSASDSDGDLSTVEVRLLDSSGTLEESASIDVSGGSASGTTTLKAKHDDGTGNSYTAELVVTDSNGNTSTSSQSVSENGS